MRFERRRGAATATAATALLAMMMLTMLGEHAAGAASVAPVLSVQGVLRKADGALAPDGNYDLGFGLYAAASGGAELSRIDKRGVPVKRGVFAVTLDLGDGGVVTTNAALWVEVTIGVNGTKLPRQRLVPTAFALQAEHANTADAAQSALHAETAQTAVSATTCSSANSAGALMCTGCVAPEHIGFNFAASASHGGPASDLACTGCVQPAELAPCLDGQVLKFIGSGWACATESGGGGGTGGGTVTSVTAGSGLTGGAITTAGTIAVDPTVVPTLAGNSIFTGQPTFKGGMTQTGWDWSVKLRGVGGARGQILFTDDSDANAGNIQAGPTLFTFNMMPAEAFQIVNGVPKFYVTPAGNVGIGTTAPEEALHVATALQVGGARNQANENHIYMNGDIIRHYFGVSEGPTTNNGRFMLMANGSGWVDPGNDAGALLLRSDPGNWSAVSGGVHFKIFTGGTSAGVSQELNNATATLRMIVADNGNVGIGTATPANKLGVMGNIAASGTVMGGVGAPDLAENITASEARVEAGDVVIADPAGAETIVRSRRAYETAVLGVISTKPGMLINAEPADLAAGHGRDPRQRPLALAGRVPVKVTLEGGPIRAGDLLASSSTPGHAMKALEPWRGGIVGTALEAFPPAGRGGGERGKVVAFLNLQPAPQADPRVVRALEARVVALEAQVRDVADSQARLAAIERKLATLTQPHRTRRIAGR